MNGSFYEDARTVRLLSARHLGQRAPAGLDPEADARHLYAELPADVRPAALWPWMDTRGIDANEKYRKELWKVCILLRMGEDFRRGRALESACDL